MELNRQHNQLIKQLYKHLIDQANNKKVAITACIRRMITILNTMMRNAEEWRMSE
jgi:transposase